MRENHRKFPVFLAVLGSAVLLVLILILSSSHPAYALPEYAHRTNESCSTCHVNPGGGGPRTMRGLLWAAKGKPGTVPDLPGVLVAPGVSEGEELYQVACVSCHGVYGEGMFGAALRNGALQENKIRSNILRGRMQSGMPSFDKKFTDEQLAALVIFVLALENGQVTPQPATFLLEPPQFQGIPHVTPLPAEGN